MTLLLAFASLHGLTGLLLVLAAIGSFLALGTVNATPHATPVVPSTSPDSSTLLGQNANLSRQFEVLAGTTDVITGGGGGLTSLPAGAPAPITGRSFLTSAGVNATTLAAPVAGDPAAGGNDGLSIEIVNQSGQAHTVTTPANKINGNKHIATFPATVGSRITLTALNGVWYSDGGGTTLT